MGLSCLVLAISVACSAEKARADTTSVAYGADVSFPVHHRVSENYPWLAHNVDPDSNTASPLMKMSPLQVLGDRHRLYVEHLKGCRENSEISSECDQYELNRLLMNLRQPQSVKNYTGTSRLC
jgi:hypothetical protein